MHLSLINPYIRAAMRSTIPNGRSIMQRIIYDYELIYLESGRFTFIYDGKKYKCESGDFIFIRPGISHSFNVDSGDISQPHIHFDITYRPESESIPISFKDRNRMSEAETRLIHNDYFKSSDPFPIIKVEEREKFLEYFYRIIDENDDGITKKALIMQLISMIIKDNYKNTLEEEAKPSIAARIKDYIDAGNGISMSLDDFEGVFFLSKFHLERKFREAYGISIAKYRNERRMLLAKNMLRKNSVSKTAELLGFSSIYSFSRAYKTHFGCAPTNQKSK